MNANDLKKGVIYVGTYRTKKDSYIFTMTNDLYNCVGINLNTKQLRNHQSYTACLTYREATDEEIEIFNLSVKNKQYTEPIIMDLDSILKKLNL